MINSNDNSINNDKDENINFELCKEFDGNCDYYSSEEDNNLKCIKEKANDEFDDNIKHDNSLDLDDYEIVYGEKDDF